MRSCEILRNRDEDPVPQFLNFHFVQLINMDCRSLITHWRTAPEKELLHGMLFSTVICLQL
jgi:hypothetical protein